MLLVAGLFEVFGSEILLMSFALGFGAGLDGDFVGLLSFRLDGVRTIESSNFFGFLMVRVRERSGSEGSTSAILASASLSVFCFGSALLGVTAIGFSSAFFRGFLLPVGGDASAVLDSTLGDWRRRELSFVGFGGVDVAFFVSLAFVFPAAPIEDDQIRRKQLLEIDAISIFELNSLSYLSSA